MSSPDFKTRAKQVLRRAVGVPEPTDAYEHPFATYNPNAEPVRDVVTAPREISAEDAHARRGHLSDEQVAGFKAGASIRPPAAERPRVTFGGSNGVVTGWRGAQA